MNSINNRLNKLQEKLNKTSYAERYKAASKETRSRLFIDQDKACAICRVDLRTQKKAGAIDHCHTTGIIRGMLCLNCNLGLGLFKDRIDVLEQAIEYLRKYQIEPDRNR